VDAFEQFVRGGLGLIGLEAGDDEIQIMRFVDGIYGERLRALEAEALGDVWAEPDMDPGRAPSP
jgi:hypothetical protein